MPSAPDFVARLAPSLVLPPLWCRAVRPSRGPMMYEPTREAEAQHRAAWALLLGDDDATEAGW